MGRHRRRRAIERQLLLGRLRSLLSALLHVLLGELLHVLLGELLLKEPLLLMLMLQVQHRFLSFLGTHPSELCKLGGRYSGYLLTNSGGERSRIHTIDRPGRLLEDLAGIHLGCVEHLLWLPTVCEHLIGVDAMMHDPSLNHLAGSHHRAVSHRAPPPTTATATTTRVHKLASSIVHRRVRRLLHPIIRKLGWGCGRLLELGGLLLGCVLGLGIKLGLRLLGLGVLIGGQKGGVDTVCVCGIHGMLKIWRQRESTWWTMEHGRS